MDESMSNSDQQKSEMCSRDRDKTLPRWGDSDLLARLLDTSIDELLEPVAHAGDKTQGYFKSLRDVHLLMRKNYLENIYQVGRNIFPLIIASDNEPGFEGVGASYTLYLEDGTSERIVPVSREYEMHKCLSHIPLGIFAIIAPYFSNPQSQEWINPLQRFQSRVEAAQQALNNASLDTKTINHNKAMLTLAAEYLSACLAKKNANHNDFIIFSEQIFPFIEESTFNAARLQVQDTIPELLKWKQKLGEKWRDLYVVIPTVWPVSGRNPRQQIFEKIMDQERIKTHIIMLEGVKNKDEALTSLGRIVADRTVARLVFGTRTATSRSMVCALSTPRDIVSDACEAALKEIEDLIPD